MQNLQAHAPEMKEIQQRWKHDRQRQNEELMKFYRENKINPASSCLPIVLQIPIFISLFYVLKDFEREVWSLPKYQGTSLDFLGLVDITQPTIESWGPVLLFIYVASQLTSSYYMSISMQKAQRVLLMVLPIVFIPFILRFPAGLMIYWMTTNLWTTGQGFVTRRLMPKPDTSGPKRSSRTAPKEEPPPAQGSNKRPGQKQPPKPSDGTGRTVAGPPRRVKRKRSGGGRRR
jgi:YidC/Oxa1 family membrane protein insertase